MASGAHQSGHGYLTAPDYSGARTPDPEGKFFGDKQGQGRPKGIKNALTTEARDLAREIVRDPKYRANLLDRAQNGRLPSNIEAMLWAYAYGRPTERVEVTHTTASARLSEMSTSELAERAEMIAKVLKELGDVDAANVAMRCIDVADSERASQPIDVTPTKVA